MKKLALAIVGLAVVASASPVFAAPSMDVVKTCVAKEKKELGIVGYSSYQSTMFIDACVRNGGR